MNFVCEEDKYIVQNLLPFNHSFPKTFVEIGAYDGLHGSNTLYFERNLGWRGVCVEPDPFKVLECFKNRANTIAAACGTGDPLQIFYINMEDHGLSGLTRGGIPYRVPVIRLDTIIQSVGLGHISLLSIDTEGTEIDVWNSGQEAWEKFGKPEIVIMEHLTCGESNLEPLLYKMTHEGYKEVHRTYCNCIFRLI